MNTIVEGSIQEAYAAECLACEKLPNLERYITKTGAEGCIKANVSNRNTLVIGYWRLWRMTQSTRLERIQGATELAALAEEDHDECPICLEPISEGLVVLKCKHKFCASCFAQHARCDNKCGLCRDQFATPVPLPPPPPLNYGARTDIETILDEIYDLADAEEQMFEETLSTT